MFSRSRSRILFSDLKRGVYLLWFLFALRQQAAPRRLSASSLVIVLSWVNGEGFRPRAPWVSV